MTKVEIKHAHLFCGLGGGKKGFNRAKARVGNLESAYRCIGGIDVIPAAIRDFDNMGHGKGTVMDLFSRSQYVAWNGHEPPSGWREMLPADILRALGNECPDVWFLSAPCKGFSGLLSNSLSASLKYQALNELTLRGIWLALEACKDDPASFILFENVPRIATRGRHLLDQIVALLRAYGYAVAETTHDCGELGNLAQSRKRFLLVARHVEKVPPFLYEPPKRPLRAVGEILGKMPRPGDSIAGPMHRMPALQWKTWVRLAFVEAGSDWRSLNKLAVENGVLRDYLLVPEMHRGVYGVTDWNETANTVTSGGRVSQGKFAVADPSYEGHAFGQWGVRKWAEPAGVVTGQQSPGQGPISVSDPRFDPGHYDSVQYGVRGWNQSTGVVTGQRSPSQGAFSVADPHIGGVRHNNVFRVISLRDSAGAVTAGGHPTSGGQSVADPLPPKGPLFSKYAVSEWTGKTGTVIGGDDTGAYAIADPKPNWSNRRNNLAVMDFAEPAHTITGGGKGVQGGSLSVADPVIDPKRPDFLSGGHYGVLRWNSTAYAVTGSARQDSGPWSVADPQMPAATERLVAVIRSLDGTWHRPFTTLELAALQSLIEPEEYLELDGLSDSAWRERIGNAVPPAAAEAMATVIAEAFLLAKAGETFLLSASPIWVRNVAIALSVKPI